MARSFTLRITQAVINQSAREHSKRCMIACAIKEAGATYPIVTKEYVSFNFEGTHYHYPLPAKAAAELIKFDDGETVQPFILTLSGQTATTRPIQKKKKNGEVKRRKKIDVTKMLKGARKRGLRESQHGVRRGFRRAEGLRMLEVKD